MTRVLISGMTDTIGGMETFVMSYVRSIDPAQVQFDFLCVFPKIQFEEELLARGCRVYHITARSKDYWKNRRELRAFFQEHGRSYDVIWCQKCDLVNCDDLKLAQRAQIPRRIIHSHNTANMRGGLAKQVTTVLHRSHKQQIGQLATDYWACGQEAGAYFYDAQLRESSRFRVIPNAIHTERFAFNPNRRSAVRERLGLGDEFVVGFVGRLHRQKNPLFLADLIAELVKRRPDARLLVVGDGELRPELEARVDALGMGDAVCYTGVCDCVPDMLQAMDAFVLPSLFEGLAIALVEAQAAGLQIYTSKDRVTTEAKLTDLLHFLPLEEGASAWAEAILAHSEIPRRDMRREMAEVNYDIQANAEWMTAFLTACGRE